MIKIVRGPLKELLPFIVNIEQLFVIFVTCIKIISKTTWPNLTKLGHNHNTRVSILKKKCLMTPPTNEDGRHQ